MRIAILFLVLVGAAFAGCFGADDDHDADGHDHDSDGNDQDHDGDNGDNQTADPAPPPAAPPQPNITVDVDFGEAPLAVTFVLDDLSEGEAEREWTFTVDGNGTADAEGNEFQLPFEFTFTYDEPGLYTATFTITSGNDTVTANRLITVEAAEVPEFEDRGWYIFETATSHCHVKEYVVAIPPDGVSPVFYVSELNGGMWLIMEDNGVEGLQIEDNFPLKDQVDGFTPPGIEDCEDGDLIVV